MLLSLSLSALRRQQALASCCSRREIISRVFRVGAPRRPCNRLGTAVIALAPLISNRTEVSRSVAVVYRYRKHTTAIIEEKNAFTLFITGVYGAAMTNKELEKLEKKALAA